MGPDSTAIPPELTGPTPRNVRITDSGILSAVVAVVALALAVALAIKLGHDISQRVQQIVALRDHGAVADGEVIELTSRGRSHVPAIRYAFVVNGTYMTGEATVPGNLRGELREHSLVSIRYIPSNPAVNHPAGWEDSGGSNWLMEIVPAMPAVFGVWLLVTLGKERKLLARGLPAIATIMGCKRSRNGFYTAYDFQMAEGQGANGGYTFNDRQETGTSICVLYMPQKADSNEPYLQLDSYRIAE